MLSTPAKRIVALSPHIVENLFSAGLGEKIVASVSYADYPAAAKNIPRIGGFSNFSVESIIAHQPDLVIGWASGFAGFAALRERLEQLGIAVYVDDPRSPHDIPRSIADFAQLGGSDKNWQAAVAQYTAQLQQLQQHPAVPNANVDSATATDRVRAKTQTLMDTEVSVFYEIWHRPLQTLNGEHIVSELIQLCGGRNIFADAAVIAPNINVESLLAADPDVIIASASDNKRPLWLEQWQQWPALRAVQSQHIYFIPGDLLSRHSLRIAEGAAMLCEYIDRVRQARKATRNARPLAIDARLQ
ncbi:MAG: cobalamin-binding protein, partial [Gammaproteobacteria bacterium]|nr:cobalamin-binding protein [Gammaproteobacteria bacterium]